MWNFIGSFFLIGNKLIGTFTGEKSIATKTLDKLVLVSVEIRKERVIDVVGYTGWYNH